MPFDQQTSGGKNRQKNREPVNSRLFKKTILFLLNIEKII